MGTLSMFGKGITSVLANCHLLRQFCSFLVLFATFHAKDAQIGSAAHRVLPVVFFSLEQYHNIILILQKQSPHSDSLNAGSLTSKFSRGCPIILISSISRAHIKCSFCSAYQAQQCFSSHSAHFAGLPSSGAWRQHRL
jgi:hypothetical protein